MKPQHIPDIVEVIEARSMRDGSEPDLSPMACIARAAALLEHVDRHNRQRVCAAAVKWLGMAMMEPINPEDER